METIPKIIHYCWFGNNEKPRSVLKYIQGWKEKLSDYKFIEWNESNFDIECCNYVSQAYKAKKFAFVADYARLKALYEHGGIYLDTDVEVVQSFNELIEENCADLILGFEEKNWVCTSTIIAKKENIFIKYFLNSYMNKQFISNNGKNDTTTNVNIMTNLLIDFGLTQENKTQKLKFKNSTIIVLDQQYFSPMDYINRIDNRTKKTIVVHHYDITWGKNREFIIRFFKLFIVKVLGRNLAKKFWDIIRGNSEQNN